MSDGQQGHVYGGGRPPSGHGAPGRVAGPSGPPPYGPPPTYGPASDGYGSAPGGYGPAPAGPVYSANPGYAPANPGYAPPHPPAQRAGSSTYGRAGGTDQARPGRTGSPGKNRPTNKRPQGRGPAGPKPKRRHSPIWTMVVLGFGVLVMLAGVGGIVGVNYTLNQANNLIAQPDLLGGNVATGNTIKGAINILLVGVDTRPTGDIGSHSDTIIIAHIPAAHDRVYLISIPRDTNATVPSDSKTHFSGGSYKINASFTFGSANGGGEAGGFQLLAKTLKNEYGLTFNGGAIVNFSGFQDIVTELGGVHMYVDETTTSIHHGYLISDPKKTAAPYKIDKNTGVPICSDHHVTFDSDPIKCALPGIMPVQYIKGPHDLTAYQALDFVRCRDGLVGTDYARQRHQQQFIKAVMQEAYSKGFSDPLKLNAFMKAISKAFEFAGGGVPLSDWLFTLKGITPSSMITIKTNDGQYAHYTGPAPDSRQTLTPDSLELVQDVIHDKVDTFVETHPDWVAS